MAMLLRDDNVFHQQCPRSYLAGTAERHGVHLTVVGAPDALPGALADADIFVGSETPPDVLAMAPGLAWIHAIAAGVEKVMVPAIRDSNVRVTNSAGTMAPEVAEHALALTLALTRRIDRVVVAQRGHEWAPIRRDHPPISLGDLLVGIVGYGRIGRAIAARAGAFGARVIGLRRLPAEPDGHAEQILGRDGLVELLSRADVVMAALPDVPDAHGMFGARAFQVMKPTAYFINVGRGAVVDEIALARALGNGLIAGAACDVFREEPLPADSPLWDAPNFIMSPHLAGGSQHVWKRVIDLLFDNVERWRRGAPLLNEVDKASGY
ncbi:MAG TPA: D-2-hydroxyacid dehydrogenase [Bauldia sp.]|nr:D-2-hydroxyacid dehydrogenase [Bauldia sp.]